MVVTDLRFALTRDMFLFNPCNRKIKHFYPAEQEAAAQEQEKPFLHHCGNRDAKTSRESSWINKRISKATEYDFLWCDM